jgi:Inositol monophosphatase family
VELAKVAVEAAAAEGRSCEGCWGAAALDLAWVASGVFDGFFELGLESGMWRRAVLIREAGGVVTDWEGDDRFLQSGMGICAGGAARAAPYALELAEASPPAAPAALIPGKAFPCRGPAPYIRRGQTVGEGSEGMETGMSR